MTHDRQENRLGDPRAVWGLFALCWLTYFVSYLGRLNYSAVMSALIGTRVTRVQAGWVSTAFLAAYAVGQLVNGLLADRFDPRRMVVLGLLLGAACNALFAFAGGFLPMLLLRMLTGYAMSMLWPSMLGLFARLYVKGDMVRFSVHLASSMAAGTLVSYALSAGMLSAFGWQAAFIVPGLLLFVVALLWLLSYGSFLRSARDHGVRERAAEVPPESRAPGHSLLSLLLLPGVALLLIPAAVHGALKDGVTAWIPTYISEVFALDPATSALLITCLPLVNVGGAYLARWMYARCREDEQRGMAIFFGVACLALLVLWGLGKYSLPLTVCCFAVITSAMLAVNTLLVSILPLRYHAQGKTASLSGLLNATAYGGSALASGLIGLVATRWGWTGAVLSWLLCALLACAVCLLSARRRISG